MSEHHFKPFDTDFYPPLPCPKGCNLEGESSMQKMSTVWVLAPKQGSASTKCVVCQHSYIWDFISDVPFEYQKIAFRLRPEVYSLNGVLGKSANKKSKGDT